ncbi:hypothetical protein LTR56_001730 [Elasticomyces elasticus]|nr:hypothetical protein LTR22_020359 [Elasticomyces elasticus]KAK3658859.1 hypothetical protein LTR56_001730 [Elasticomyces elasticus]KAK4932702.1 hypothetical protein LTR49_001126 [Elasticomyces elasticus]KAK5769724.1 hypothetical protein LTS12_000174 [Elasticomyces elasticus]
MKITATLAVAFLGLVTFCTAAPPKPMPPQSKSFWPNSWKTGPCDKDKMNRFTCNIMCKCPDGWDGKKDGLYRKARSVLEDSSTAAPTAPPPTPVLVSAPPRVIIPFIHTSRPCRPDEKQNWLHCNWICDCADYDYGNSNEGWTPRLRA